jgi:hypothetical protein
MWIINQQRAKILQRAHDYNALIDRYTSLEGEYSRVLNENNSLKQRDADLAHKVRGSSKTMVAKCARFKAENKKEED